MIFDVFKIVVWLIERYNLHEQVKEHLSNVGSTEEGEAVMVEPQKPYLMHFDKPAVTPEEIIDKIVECTEREKK